MTQITESQPAAGAGSRSPGRGEDGGRPGALARLWSIPATRALVALVFVLGIGCLFNADGAFFKFGTHRDALRQAPVFGILACGMTLVIISGGIDLAVGSVLALLAVTFSLMSIHWGWSPWVAIPACLLLGMACGTVSGGLTSWFGIQPFIATLAQQHVLFVDHWLQFHLS
jgi:ribose/xylose/arabinose/galactoside ABC-type transport system permease subunit